MQCWEREIAERPKLQTAPSLPLAPEPFDIYRDALPSLLSQILLPPPFIPYFLSLNIHLTPTASTIIPTSFTSNWASQGRRRHPKALRKVQEQSLCRLSVTSGLPSCCLGCCCFLSGMKRTEVSSSKQKLGILTKFNRTQKLRKNTSGGDKKCSALVWISFQRRALNWLSYKGWYYQL